MISPASYRKARLRDQRRTERIPDPLDPTGEALFHPSPFVRHGTEAGYTEWWCRCTRRGQANAPLNDDGTPVEPWGCQQAGVAAAAARKVERRQRKHRADQP